MVRPSKKDEPSTEQRSTEDEQKRSGLRKLIYSRNLFSQAPPKPNSRLAPSKLVAKHHGRDVVKKSQRKNRFLFSFPGLIAPINGGKIGELKDLETENPVLYLDFPQGRMKLFGTIVYPKNRYLTMQFSRGGKGVTCDDYFDSMIVFPEAWWIGKKSENPEENRLEFPKDVEVGERQVEYDFKGGAGVTSEEKPGTTRPVKDIAEPESPVVDVDDETSEDSAPLTGKTTANFMESTPVRQSARMAGKKLNYADDASGDDSVESNDEITEVPEKRLVERNDRAAASSVAENILFDDAEQDDMNGADAIDLPGNNLPSSVSAKKSKESSQHKRGSLVQATIATLFEKVGEKKSSGSVKRSLPKESAKKSRVIDSKQKNGQIKDEGPKKKGAQAKRRKTDAGSETITRRNKSQVVDDDIEDFSCESQDGDGTDEDWAG
ncbi:hypothetical protein Scep_015948 [Stephania cephalantha]|uniref:DNA-binding protein RHL1 n=1 Tax=Stephania cephalantha TaxID=152367 RepID=A0AAP0IMJ0_9MAGN